MNKVARSHAPSENGRILVVDDDERNLLALSEVLNPVADVVCSSSGRDALRQLLRGEFAVILLDVFMPDLDGYETAALIRERDQTSRVPIIFLSAVNKETEHLMRGYAMGAVDYVFKPVDPIMLKSKVSVFVDLFNMRKQLEESEERQASILRALPMAIYEVTERNGQMLQQFRGGDLAHFLGEEADDVLSGKRQWQDWLHPEDRPRVDREVKRESEAITSEYRWVGPKGIRHHILDHRVASGNNAGTKRWAGSLLDITERKELEAKLVHAGKLDALGQLTGGVAHDFNNLLAAILGGVNILQRRLVLGEREQVVIDQMRHAATHGSELVRRMMAFSRQQELTPGAIDPASLCETVLGLVSHTLGAKVTVEWENSAGGFHFFVDRSQLELSLMNLIINARDAMPDGGEITVRILSGDDSPEDGSPMLVIQVSDSGTGMPAEVLARVTEPFFTTKETGKGTGLGLSMVSGFAHQSGGEMHIDSVVGTGTTIELLLPATTAAPASQVGSEAGDGALEWMKGARVAVIDDDAAVRTVLSEQFRDAEALVTEYVSGDEAVTAFSKRDQAFDYVLCDFAMPGIDGITTLTKTSELLPRAKMAIMTGNADEPRLANGARWPILRKPLDMIDLGKVFG